MSRTRGRRTHVRSYVRKDGTRVKSYTQNRRPGRKRTGAVAVAGAALILGFAGLAGGGGGGVASVSGAADGVSASVKTSRGPTEVRIRGASDALRATIRLQRMGGRPTTLDAQSVKNCSDHSDGDIQRFFRAHECTSLYRTLIEYREGNYVIRFLIATIEMSDRDTAKDLHALLLRNGSGDIAPLFPGSGEYRHVPFASGPSKTRLHGTTVTNIRTQAVGRTPGADVLASLAMSVLSSLD